MFFIVKITIIIFKGCIFLNVSYRSICFHVYCLDSIYTCIQFSLFEIPPSDENDQSHTRCISAIFFMLFCVAYSVFLMFVYKMDQVLRQQQNLLDAICLLECFECCFVIDSQKVKVVIVFIYTCWWLMNKLHHFVFSIYIYQNVHVTLTWKDKWDEAKVSLWQGCE